VPTTVRLDLVGVNRVRGCAVQVMVLSECVEVAAPAAVVPTAEGTESPAVRDGDHLVGPVTAAPRSASPWGQKGVTRAADTVVDKSGRSEGGLNEAI